ncbi:uncharacterized protein LOC128954371 [Oppia nitens]|uniref:uncharacterized protein LOC128954371 n=1 Tax=Oppia nitens TaxID=1686743 RepID=UPI0023DA7FFD|nr:uncharacterized protein LOC128954371 [Oppia nitens]
MTATTTTTATVMTTPKNDSFYRFGDDLSQLLLQYLPIDISLRLQSVSKQFRQTFSLIFTATSDLVFDKKLLKRLSMNSLHDNSCDDYPSVDSLKVFELLLKKCPNIASITISDMYLHDLYFELLMKYSHRLRHIYLKSCNDYQQSSNGKQFNRFSKHFGQQLLTFKFDSYDRYIYIEEINKAIACMTNLKTLDITNRYDLNVQLSDIFTDDDNKSYVLPKSLQSITIRLNSSSMLLFPKFADIYGQQLKSLNILFECCYDKDNDRKSNCRRLNVFDFVFMSSKSTINRVFAVINKHMSRKQLRRLSVECFLVFGEDLDPDLVLLTSDSFNRLNRLTHLTLKLRDCRIIGDQFFRDIHRNLPRLQSIHCNSCSSITDESIQAMGQLAHLRDVCLSSDYIKQTITDEFISRHLLSSTKVKHFDSNSDTDSDSYTGSDSSEQND